MENNFDHFILTRFNLRKKEWTTNKNNVAVLTDEWLTNRMALFQRFCYPSVKGQSNKNFKWCVFFDTTTPAVVKEQITQLSAGFQQFHPIYCDGMEAFLPGIEKEISKSSKPYVITTRLDNDDCISKDFVSVVQSRFKSQEFMALDFIKGYTLKIGGQYKLGYKIHPFNPFMSLIEKNDRPETIWSKGHTAWKKEHRMVQDMDETLWMSIIHEENKVNEFTGFGNCDVTKVLNNFQLNPGDRDEIVSKAIPFNQWKSLSFKNKLDSYFKLYSKKAKRKIGLY